MADLKEQLKKELIRNSNIAVAECEKYLILIDKILENAKKETGESGGGI